MLDSCQFKQADDPLMVQLNYLSIARLHGPDAGDFLHSQLSADIAALAPGDASFGCCCTPKGQVIGLLLVCRQGDDFLLAGSAELLPRVLTRLKMFVLRSRVEFDTESGLSIYGAESASAFPGIATFQPADLALHYHFSRDQQAADKPEALFKALELTRQVAWLSEETSEKFIPQMLGYDAIGAVSFTKGCYPGQEIVARARYLGTVKRKPVIVQISELLTVQPAGRVELRRGESWTKGVAVDSVHTDGGTVVFTVSPVEPDEPVIEIRYEDRVYRCATM